MSLFRAKWEVFVLRTVKKSVLFLLFPTLSGNFVHIFNIYIAPRTRNNKLFHKNNRQQQKNTIKKIINGRFRQNY